EHGGAGGTDLAEEVLEVLEQEQNFTPRYEDDLAIDRKIEKIVTEVYAGDGVVFTVKAKKPLAEIELQGWDNVPVCMGKTQYSFSDAPALLGKPFGFKVTVRELIAKNGAGFVLALTGDIMTMPGLPNVPSAVHIDVDADGNSKGLF